MISIPLPEKRQRSPPPNSNPHERKKIKQSPNPIESLQTPLSADPTLESSDLISATTRTTADDTPAQVIDILPPLLALPNELKDLIVEYILEQDQRQEHDRHKTILAVVLTCKYLQELATPLLYRNVRLHIDNYVTKFTMEYVYNIQRHTWEKPYESKKKLIIAIMSHVRKYTKDLRLTNNRPTPGIQQTVYDILTSLSGAKLRKLKFCNIAVNKQNSIVLGNLLGDLDSTLRSSIEEINLQVHYDDVKQSSPMMDCTAQYRFIPAKREGTRPVQIRVTGIPDDDGSAPLQGTSLQLQQRVLNSLGTDNGFEEIKLTPHRRPMNHILDIIEPRAGNPLPIRTLCVKDGDLGADLPSAFYRRVDLSSIRNLVLYECANVEPFFSQLILISGTLTIQKLIMENWLILPTWKQDTHGNIQDLLFSFNTLKHLDLTVCEPWEPDLIKMLDRHDLHTLVLSFGRNNTFKGLIKEIHCLCPNLHVLGFRNSVFELPFRHGHFPDTQHRKSNRLTTGFDTKFAPIADELAKFHSLHTLWVFMQSGEASVSKKIRWNYHWWSSAFRNRFWPKKDELDANDSYGAMSRRVEGHIYTANPSSQLTSVNSVDKAEPSPDWSDEKYKLYLDTDEEEFRKRYSFSSTPGAQVFTPGCLEDQKYRLLML